jgi:hypothetical protein
MKLIWSWKLTFDLSTTPHLLFTSIDCRFFTIFVVIQIQKSFKKIIISDY